jgi:hypothetical protein
MKKSDGFILLICGLLSSSCSTYAPVSKGNLSDPNFDAVQIEQSSAAVEKIAGPPKEIIKINDEIVWIFENHDENGFQRASITFDKSSGMVKNVTILPRPTDKERNLDYLKQKLPGEYQAILLDRCHRDYFPSITYYLNATKGIIIEFDRNGNFVHSYSKTSSQNTLDFLGKLKRCEK